MINLDSVKWKYVHDKQLCMISHHIYETILESNELIRICSECGCEIKNDETKCAILRCMLLDNKQVGLVTLIKCMPCAVEEGYTVVPL